MRHSPRRVALTYERRKALDQVDIGSIERRFARIRIQRLNADVIRARLPVLADAPDERIFIAPRDQCVDESIRPIVGEIAVVETRAPPTVHVVGQAEIRAQIGARDLAGALGVRFQQNLLFYTEEFVWAENCARFGRLRNGRVIGMSAIADAAGGWERI